MDLTSAEFRVQVHKIPKKMANLKMTEFIAAQLGNFIRADMSNCDCTWIEFIRLPVCIDISKPLRQKIKIKNGKGEVITLECKYERLPTYCFYCGIIGHSERFCVKLFESSNAGTKRTYGPELRAGGR